jgi:hypothetical protein
VISKPQEGRGLRPLGLWSHGKKEVDQQVENVGEVSGVQSVTASTIIYSFYTFINMYTYKRRRKDIRLVVVKRKRF